MKVMTDYCEAHNESGYPYSSSMTDVVDIEFPAIDKHDGFYTLDLSRKIHHNVYKKCFVKSYLAEILTYGNYNSKELCHAEYFMILQNPKYDYLYKNQTITL